MMYLYERKLCDIVCIISFVFSHEKIHINIKNRLYSFMTLNCLNLINFSKLYDNNLYIVFNLILMPFNAYFLHFYIYSNTYCIFHKFLV